MLCTQFEGAPATDIIESLGSLRKIQKMHAFDRWAAVGQCVPPVPVPEVFDLHQPAAVD